MLYAQLTGLNRQLLHMAGADFTTGLLKIRNALIVI